MTHDDGSRPPRPSNGHERMDRLERRVRKLEQDLSDLMRQHRADMEELRRKVDAKVKGHE